MGSNAIKQYEQYVGPICDTMPGGDYLSVRRLSAVSTDNENLWQTWREINSRAQKLSAQGYALQSELGRELIEDALKSIDYIFGFVANRVVTRANRLFSSTFGGPNPFAYNPFAVRWPGENPYALSIILKFVNAAFQVPQVASNRLDRGILDNHAGIILRPLFDAKGAIAQEYFGYEIKGTLSPDELDAIFAGTTLRPPLHRSFDDRRSTEADVSAKATLSATDESVERPTQTDIERYLDGKDIWTWVPSASDWAVFAETVKRMEHDAPNCEPVQPFPFTTGTIGATGA